MKSPLENTAHSSKAAELKPPHVGIVLSWPPLQSGDCQQTDAKLLCTPDGQATFSCITWTNHTHSGDTWRVGIEVKDKDGVLLFVSPMHNGPRMDDGTPPPHYRWDFSWQYDPNHYLKIDKAWQHYSC